MRFGLALLLFGSAAQAEDAGPRSAPIEAVYAVFTINLTRFIQWPEGALGPPGTPLLIGTFPRDPINPELDLAVRDESVAGHPLQTIRLHSLDDVLRCRVVFVSRGVASAGDVLQRAQHRPILTVSDDDSFLNLGGHVRFVSRPPHTQLQVSADNLRASGLQARAQLLRIAGSP